MQGRSPVAQILVAALMASLREEVEDSKRHFMDVESASDEELDRREAFVVQHIAAHPEQVEPPRDPEGPLMGLAAVAHEKERRRTQGTVPVRTAPTGDPLVDRMRATLFGAHNTGLVQ